MPHHTNYIEWTRVGDDEQTERKSDQFDNNPFDDPEVRQRIAELIARSVRTKKPHG